MSLLNKASLIQIPSGYKDGTLYSAKPTNGDGDFTFSRGSNLAATRVNSEGLIEKGRENRLKQSNNFNTFPYGPAAATVTSGFEGYDGSNDAWKVASTTIGSETRIRQSVTFTTGEVITLSVYMKKGNVNYGIVRTYAITGGGRAWFDLENGTVATENSGINGSIEDVGNGWYRCSIWGVVDTTGAVDIAPAPADGDFLADAVGEFIYIQDSMLNQGLVAQSYIPTTTTTEQAGILEDMPRLDYSGGASCPALLLEPQRSNLYTNSEYYDGYTQANLTISTNATTSPEGLQNASKLVSSSGTNIKRIQPSITTSSATDYIISAFVKKAEWDYVFIYGDGTLSSGQNAIWDLENGTITQGSGHSTIESFGQGWYKITWKATASGAGSAAPRIGITDNSSGVNSNGDGTSGVFLYGLQIEEGSYSTSYIPTYGSSVTRSADALETSPYDYQSQGVLGANVGTIILDCETIGTSTGSNDFHMFGEAKSIADGYLFRANTGTTIDILERDSNSTSAQWTGIAVKQTRNKIGVSYSGSDVDVYANGVAKSLSSGTPVGGGNINGFANSTSNSAGLIIHQILLFPNKLTNDELADLTTI